MKTNSEVSIVLDSISPDNHRLTTFQLRYWRPIHSEFMTHRTFSRNAGSSRARPTRQQIADIRSECWGPLHWGKNKPGMQATEELEGFDLARARMWWEWAAEEACTAAEQMLKVDVHKQVVNRILEPFNFIDAVVTATEWANFFKLRSHPDAQPEIKELSDKMLAAMNTSTPNLLKPSEWHLPYIKQEEAMKYDLDILKRMSVARCARVSYRSFDGTVDLKKDLDLFSRLLEDNHHSPFEHQATPDYILIHKGFVEPKWANPKLHGNFVGWRQYRKLLE